VTNSGSVDGTLTIQGSATTTYAGAINDGVTNKINLVKSGTGTQVLSGTSTYSGTTTISNGKLMLNGTHTGGGAYTIASGATLGGTGSTTSLIQGAGLVSPGTSPGIVTVGQIDPSGGMDYGFEFTATGNPNWANSSSSVNDVLRVTSATPFVNGPFDGDNQFNIYLNVSQLNDTDVFRGGIFVDADGSFLSTVQNALFNYFVAGDGGGSIVFEGNDYYTLAEYAAMENALIDISLTTPSATANFASGIESGNVMQFSVAVTQLPEPTSVVTWVLLGLVGLVGFACLARRRKLQPTTSNG
jgi:autotransporter-associated beta strand protein